ncbi:hypothetical protein PHSY_002294 [Pseudozyma hubeiensis SY62]|uniref:Uncharacterized protein n=1 Tax=Pseudozyma hubeiensis (strain SY62) TaxID=1305764 RepID=R9P0N8_PSEHS|nr:hypothetical protein PHSY_002294 [Pseudozyma hubeiensis SY62]GAC94721.1 hypothetical protein PHSY_002294 [Pseudozyma hubeiensis SY62]
MTDPSTSTTSAAVEASQAAASAMSTAADEPECTDCSPATAVSDGLEASHSAAAAMDTSQPAAENLMDPSTFIPPLSAVEGLPTPLIVIEYCQRCKFGLRANWFQQELLSTFATTTTSEAEAGASIAAVLMIPKVDDASAGRFRVYFLAPQEEQGLKLVWDRKVQSGFPEMKVLKQRVRDLINPSFGLGHSDKK